MPAKRLQVTELDGSDVDGMPTLVKPNEHWVLRYLIFVHTLQSMPAHVKVACKVARADNGANLCARLSFELRRGKHFEQLGLHIVC